MMFVRLSLIFAMFAVVFGTYSPHSPHRYTPTYKPSYPPKKVSGCYVMKVDYNYYKAYDYKYNKHGDYYFAKKDVKYCRPVKKWTYKRETCPNYKPAQYGLQKYATTCKIRPCKRKYVYAQSKCHGQVRIPEPFYHVDGKECNVYTHNKPCQTYQKYGYGGYGYPGGYGGYSGHGYAGTGYRDYPGQGYAGDGYRNYPHGSSSHDYSTSRGPGILRPYYPGPSDYQYKPTSYSKCFCQTKFCEIKVDTCYEHKGDYYKDNVIVKVPCGCFCYKDYKKQTSYGY